MTYEEAKEIAVEHAALINVTLDYAGELPGAYVFNDTKNQYEGWIPFVVEKESGIPMNCRHYMMDNKVGWDQVRELEF